MVFFFQLIRMENVAVFLKSNYEGFYLVSKTHLKLENVLNAFILSCVVFFLLSLLPSFLPFFLSFFWKDYSMAISLSV